MGRSFQTLYAFADPSIRSLMVWPDQGSRSTSSRPSSKTGFDVLPPWASSKLAVVAAARCKGEL